MNKRGPYFSLLVVATTILLQSISFSQKTYYIDTTGNDSNNGTSPGTPWKTCGKVNAEISSRHFSAGDSILFKRGQTWAPTTFPLLNMVNGSLNGSAGHPIVFGAYGAGSRPILSIKNISATSYGNTYNNVVILGGRGLTYLTIRDLELQGSWRFYPAVGYPIHDLLLDSILQNGNPLRGVGYVPTNYAFNNAFMVATEATPLSGDSMRYPHVYNLEIKNCRTEYMTRSYHVYAAYENIWIHNNASINAYYSSCDVAQGKNLKIENNYFYSDGSYAQDNGASIKIHAQRNRQDTAIIRGNLTVMLNGKTGTVAYNIPAANNLQIYNNTIISSSPVSNNYAFQIGWEHGNGTTNVIQNMNDGIGSVRNTVIANNIIYGGIETTEHMNWQLTYYDGTHYRMSENLDSMKAHGLWFKNNIIYPDGNTYLWTKRTNANGVTYYDTTVTPRVFRTTGATPDVWVYNFVTSSNFNARLNSTYGESNLNLDPLFASIKNGDSTQYRLQDASPGLNGGLAIPGYTNDIAGSPVPQSGSISIGCFQVPYSGAIGGVVDTTRLSVPILLSPSSGSTAVELTPTLSWGVVTGAERYRLQVATDSLFASLVLNDSTVTYTARQLSTLEYQKPYYWRVAAININGSSAFSIVYRFTTKIAAPSIPVLAIPSNGATSIDYNPTLVWNPVTGAQRYRLQVAKDSLFITLVVNDSGITSTSRSMSALEYQKLYYWRVAAINSTGSSAFSIPFRFTTKNEVLPAPSLVAPPVGAVDVNLTPYLTWNSITGAAQYWLQVSPDSLFITLIVNDSGITTPGYQLSQLEYQKQYHWKVSGKNGSGIGSWSSAWTFRTIIPVPVVPTSALPQDGAGEVALNPRLTWNPVANATAYRVQVAPDSLFASVIVDDSTLSAASLQLPTLINNTTYFWHVRAKNNTGSSEYSNVARFTTESQLVVDKEAIDFGNVAIGRSKTDSIKVKNNGVKSVSILNISQSSPLFSVTPQSATIEPDQSLTVTIEFTPAEKTTYTGMTSLSITKATAVETVTTKGSGIRPPKIKRTPAGVTLKVAPTGVSQDSFKVYNEGDQELVISNAHTTNPKISILPTSGLVASNDSMTFFVTAIATKSASDSGFVILVSNSDLMMDSTVIKITMVGGMQDQVTGPVNFTLRDNYPNPFNPTTTIDYQLPSESNVVMEVYNMLGQVVATLVNETVQAGYRSVVWTATNVPSGIYYCKVDAVSVQDNTKSFRQVKRMTLIK